MGSVLSVPKKLFSPPKPPDIEPIPERTDPSVQEAARRQMEWMRRKRAATFMSFGGTGYGPAPDLFKTKLGG